MHLLESRDRGTTFLIVTGEAWRVPACPMSSASLGPSGVGVPAAWAQPGGEFTLVY
jgi:hypothetical protein